MTWTVRVLPKRKDDVHGVAVCIVKVMQTSAYEPQMIECSRVAFWRRAETAARHKEDFVKVLEDEIKKAEAAASAMNELDAEYEKARGEAETKARIRIAEIFKPALAGQPEFE